MKKKKIILCSFVFMVLSIFYGVSFFIDDGEIQANTIVEEKVELKEDNNSNLVKVDIKGAVKNPGVYEVTASARIVDVIELAGGLTKSANTKYINLAKLVEDEMIIWIYTDKEIKNFIDSNIKYEYIDSTCNCPDVSTSACVNDNTNSGNKININTATLEELMTLTGIGESKALSIIEYRKKTPFTTIEDIKNVSGIGDGAFDKIKDNITV